MCLHKLSINENNNTNNTNNMRFGKLAREK